jgi:hypothetical protein
MARRLAPLLLVASLAGGCVESLEFSVDGPVAYMSGEFEEDAVKRITKLLDDNPQLTTIVMVDVPGSMDDHAALAAARLVRESQLITEVPSDGEIASGGVDFFLAGVERRIDPSGRVGVHSWSEGRKDGSELPQSDSSHALYLDYYAEMGIDESFYWFTLDAACSREIHWMSQDELEQYGVTTPAEP